MKKLIKYLIVSALLCAPLFSETTENTDYPDFVTFFNMYNKSIISSHEKLTLMNKPRKLQKLGKESVTGSRTGTLGYRTKVRGFSGVVYIEYKDYSDLEDWTLTGNTNIKANLFANGRMFGTVNIAGKYNAKIIYDDLLIKGGNAGGGFYTVEFENGPSGTVPWDAILNEDIAIEDADKKVAPIGE